MATRDYIRHWHSVSRKQFSKLRSYPLNEQFQQLTLSKSTLVLGIVQFKKWLLSIKPTPSRLRLVG